ncbi:putative disease resistance protein RGA3 [Prosopis cineraria]|uniref:putative disease resistance protein RGA3 n=1 Tax=Prosopis cineraria TaxID=364024 RepID=UPI00240F3A1C|nr:putative disease resistance protein RGA3 [Prosopis cineraria]
MDSGWEGITSLTSFDEILNPPSQRKTLEMGSFILQSGIVSGSLQVILDRFTTFAQRELGIVLGVDDEVKKLERTVLKVQAFIDSLSNQLQWPSTPLALKLWLRHLQDVLHDADDLLHEIALEISKFTSNRPTDTEQVRTLILSRFHFSLPSQVVNMQRKLEDLVKEMDGMFASEILLKATQTIECNWKLHSSSSLVDESYVVGREYDKIEVVNMLLSNGTDRESTSVIAVVGMAGIGKTTLAKLVYNDEIVRYTFDLLIWVTISVEHSVERISKSIFESATGKMLKVSDLNHIQIELENCWRAGRC